MRVRVEWGRPTSWKNSCISWKANAETFCIVERGDRNRTGALMSQDSPSSSTRGFRVHSYSSEGATVVECHGKLTSENAPLLKAEVRGMIRAHARVLLDLKEVPLMDSSGLGTVMGLYVSARTNRCAF